MKDAVYLLRLHCLQPSSQGMQSTFSASATLPGENRCVFDSISYTPEHGAHLTTFRAANVQFLIRDESHVFWCSYYIEDVWSLSVFLCFSEEKRRELVPNRTLPLCPTYFLTASSSSSSSYSTTTFFVANHKQPKTQHNSNA